LHAIRSFQIIQSITASCARSASRSAFTSSCVGSTPESAAIADLVLKYMSAETGAKNLGVKYSDGYTGLNWSTVPCLLLELGFMSNPTEDRNLVKSEYQDKLVRGLVNGICEYLGRDIPYK